MQALTGAPDDETRRTLERVRRDSEIVGASSMVRSTAHPEDENDPAARWGKRVGRALSVVLAVALVWWLGVQLGYWAPP